MTAPQFQPQFQPPPPPQYQPGPPGPPPAPPPPSAPTKLIAAVLATLAGIAAIVGTFLPFTVLTASFGGRETTISSTGWTRTVEPAQDTDLLLNSDEAHVAYYGIPLALFAVILLAGAALILVTARRPGNGIAKTVSLIGSSGLVAATLMLVMEVWAMLSYSQSGEGFKQEYTSGLGFWLVTGAGILALAALAVTLLPSRGGASAVAQPPFGQEQYVQALPSQPPPPQYQQPYQQPGQYGPPSQPFPAQPPQQQYQQPGPYGPPSQPFPAQPQAQQQPPLFPPA